MQGQRPAGGRWRLRIHLRGKLRQVVGCSRYGKSHNIDLLLDQFIFKADFVQSFDQLPALLGSIADVQCTLKDFGLLCGFFGRGSLCRLRGAKRGKVQTTVVVDNLRHFDVLGGLRLDFKVFYGRTLDNRSSAAGCFLGSFSGCCLFLLGLEISERFALGAGFFHRQVFEVGPLYSFVFLAGFAVVGQIVQLQSLFLDDCFQLLFGGAESVGLVEPAAASETT